MLYCFARWKIRFNKEGYLIDLKAVCRVGSEALLSRSLARSPSYIYSVVLSVFLDICGFPYVEEEFVGFSVVA